MEDLGTKTILHNSKCWLTADGRFEVCDHKLATKVNKELKWYMAGALPYKFEQGEEAIFYLSQIEINDTLSRFLIRKSKSTLKALLSPTQD